MGSAFPSARDRASGDLLTGDISTPQQTYTRTWRHEGHYLCLLCDVTGHIVTLTCHADLSRKHGQLSWRGRDNTSDILTMRARVTRRWAAMTSELHTGDVNKSSSATRLSQRSGSGLLHKTMNSVGESDQQVGRTKAHVTVLSLVSVVSHKFSLV